jgi:DNA primase catalytic core
MPLFPQSFIEDVRLQADIVQVVQDHVPLRRAGATYKGLCPFHAEKTPSFQVNREKGFFHCFGCGVGGDVFKFVELHEKVGFQDAVRLLAQRYGVPLPEMVDVRESSDAATRGRCSRSTKPRPPGFSSSSRRPPVRPHANSSVTAGWVTR